MSAVDRPVIIFGCPRSGTTLLGLMLHRHPRIAIPPETRFLRGLYNRRTAFGDPADKATRKRMAKFVVDRHRSRFRHLGVDGEDVRRDIINGEPTFAAAASAAFRAYAAAHGKARWGDKRPGYYGFLPELRSIFPDAQLISIVRDGRDAVASLKAQRWFPHDTATAVSMWTMAIDYAQEAARDFPADVFYELRYEDLVANTEGELRKLCDFLGEEFDPVMLDSHEVEGTGPQKWSWHRNTKKPISASHVGQWAGKLTEEEVGLCEWAMDKRLTAYGYVPTGAKRPPATVRSAYRRKDRLRRFAIRRRRLGDRMRSPLLDPIGRWLRKADKIYLG